MGKRLIQVRLDDQHLIDVEVDDTDLAEAGSASGLSPISRNRGKLGEITGSTVESAMRTDIIPTAGTILGELWRMTQQPSSVALEFGLKFSSQVGLVMAAAGVEGHIQVTLTWDRDTSSADHPRSEAVE